MGWGFLRKALQQLFHCYQKETNHSNKWKNLNIFAIDGTFVNLPHELKRIKYKTTDKKAHYPRMLISTLSSVGKAVLPFSVQICRHSDERRAAYHHFKQLDQDSLVLFDRGYMSRELLEKLGPIQAIIRVSSSSFKELNHCWNGPNDQLITIERDGFKKNLRVIRTNKKGTTYVLATTLLDSSKYSRCEIINLYRKRWNIEESFKAMKHTLSLGKFRYKKALGVKQEVLVTHIMFFLCQVLNHKTTNGNKIKKTNGKVCKAITLELFREISHTKIVRNSKLNRGIAIIEFYLQKYQSNRSFERISKKPLSKWKDKRKRKRKAINPRGRGCLVLNEQH